MKAGTLVFLIVLMFIALGFVGSEYFNVLQRVQGLQAEIDKLTQQLNETQGQLGSCQDQSQKDGKKIEDLLAKNDELQSKLNDLRDQVNELETQNAIFRMRGSIIDFMHSNPVLLAGALIAQVTSLVFRYGRELGLKFPGNNLPPTDEYVRLSPAERAWVMRKRWIDQNRNTDR